MSFPLRRRRVLPADLVPAHAAFLACAAHVDMAQRAMIRCVPSSARSLAVPPDVGADTVRLALAAAAAEMADWRHPVLEREWQACSAGLADTLGRLDAALAVVKSTVELETALTAVQDLLDPLNAFVDAEQAWAARRVKA